MVTRFEENSFVYYFILDDFYILNFFNISINTIRYNIKYNLLKLKMTILLKYLLCFTSKLIGKLIFFSLQIWIAFPIDF